MIRRDAKLGATESEGVEQVWGRERARLMVLAYLSGYAGVSVAGFSEEEACKGTWDDFQCGPTHQNAFAVLNVPV